MSNNNNVPSQGTNEVRLKELKSLYTTYLKEICPDWTEKRIKAEVKEFFREQDLNKSRRKRQAFREQLLKQMDELRTDPEKWLFGSNGCQGIS